MFELYLINHAGKTDAMTLLGKGLTRREAHRLRRSVPSSRDPRSVVMYNEHGQFENAVRLSAAG